MLPRLAAPLLACVSLLLLCGIGVAGAPNLLTNPGFETGDFTGYNVSGGDGAPLATYDQGVSCESNPTDPYSFPHSGDCAAFIRSYSPFTITQSVVVEDGRYYAFSLWLERSNLNGPVSFTATAQFTGGRAVKLLDLGAGYEYEYSYSQFATTLHAPAHGVNTLTLAFVADNSGASWSLDDLSLTVIAPPPQGAENLLVNPSFESGNFSGYLVSGDLTGNDVECYGGGYYGPRTGNCVLFLTSHDPFTLSQTVAALDGRSYLLSFWLAESDLYNTAGLYHVNSFSAVVQFDNGSTITTATVLSVKDIGVDQKAPYTQYAGTVTAPATGHITLTVTFNSSTDSHAGSGFELDDLSLTLVDSGVKGDPVVDGLRGQHFNVKGAKRQVMVMLSTAAVQLNVRYVWLSKGKAMTAKQQRVVRAMGELPHAGKAARGRRHASGRLPDTTAWSHAGTYIGECGVVLADGSRLYLAAGAYQTGLANVTLNGAPLAVSSEATELGSGVNAVTVHRLSSHELLVRSAAVELTVVNSDRFLNLHNVHLEPGADQTAHMGGVLGATNEPDFEWSAEKEAEYVVHSGDLFERTAGEA